MPVLWVPVLVLQAEIFMASGGLVEFKIVLRRVCHPFNVNFGAARMCQTIHLGNDPDRLLLRVPGR
jgi:hypothetical protein